MSVWPKWPCFYLGLGLVQPKERKIDQGELKRTAMQSALWGALTGLLVQVAFHLLRWVL